MKIILPAILTMTSALFSMHSIAQSSFNQNLEQLLECKKTIKDYSDLGFDFEDDLKKNGWKKQGTDYRYKSKTPITVYGYSTNEIQLVVNGMVAVLKNADTKKLATQFKITQHPFFKGMPYFSGEKIVKADIDPEYGDKSFRKLTLAESNPNAESDPNETYIGCVYILEEEQKQQDAAFN